jgi:hypothetical protein
MKKQVPIEAPDIRDLNPETIVEAYQWCLETAGERADWYRRRSRNFKCWSKYLRILTLILVALGILAPLYESILATSSHPVLAFLPEGFNYIELGYLAVAVGGVIYLFDKVFGLSKGWIRFMTTLIRIQNRIRSFQMGWIEGMATETGSAARVTLMHEFITDINKITESETIQWASEFENSLALIESLSKPPVRK